MKIKKKKLLTSKLYCCGFKKEKQKHERKISVASQLQQERESEAKIEKMYSSYINTQQQVAVSRMRTEKIT